MVLPIDPIFARNPVISEEDDQAILKYELQLLSTELDDLQNFRKYYDGDQGMVFGTEKFKEKFGPAFTNFRDNWCAPVVDAIADKLHIEGLILGTGDEEAEENEDLANSIWQVFRANDFDVQQSDAHEGALVEGRAYAIVWPDDELDVRIDWNSADLIRVRYAEDDPRKMVWAMKRWLTPSGDIYITTYTQDAIRKYIETGRELTYRTDVGIAAQRPQNSPSLAFMKRRVADESWPLPNPYEVVPVVELVNKHGSELSDVIPLQDTVNYLMLQALTAAGFQGWPQRGFFSGVKEPDGGWENDPGRLWQVPPDLDAEGNLHPGSSFEFKEASLDGFRSLIEMTLTHIALQTKTPVRMFFQSDRGGRGDAPSGESLLVEDQPLLDKVEDRQRRYGNGWYQVSKMIARMSKTINRDSLPLGEVLWRDPRSKYRSALIEEGAKMVKDMGAPLKFVAHHLGFSSDEVDMLIEMIDEAKEEKMAEEEAKLKMVAENTPDPVAPQGSPRPAPKTPPRS